jgi:hypothetical protein
MAKIIGHTGVDGEERLIAALKAAVGTEVKDAWDRIRDEDMFIGSIVDIQVGRGYVKASRLGFAGYFVTKLGCAETYIRQCWQCWQKRRDFDTVKDWVSTNDTYKDTYKPNKGTGPLLFLDAHKA